MGKRVFWLLNHSSLRAFEVPLLIELGYEVYCPKKYSFGYGDLSASCTYEFDQTLSIPKDVLVKLNDTDFYSNEISDEVMDAINTYFDIIFLPIIPALRRLALAYKGQILLRAFGLEKPSTYTDVLLSAFGNSFSTVLKSLGNRFWFAECYQDLEEVECDFIKTHTLFLPLGMKNARPLRKWVGMERKMLFVSPKIETNPYYHQVYQNFIRDFKGIPRVISGGQLQEVPYDSDVTGYLPDAEYEYVMTHLACMYYHSQEPRHVHYHPFEAVRYGMPLVFMAGGLIDSLGGKILPGRCETVKEARAKVRRLIDGDHALIRKITESQEILLKPFTKEYCKPYWVEGMRRLEEAITNARRQPPKRKRVGIVLPMTYTGGVLDFTKRFTIGLKQCADEQNAPVDFVFGYPDDPVFEGKKEILDIQNSGVTCVKIVPTQVNAAQEERILRLNGFGTQKIKGPWCDDRRMVMDGELNIQDCDYLLYTVDRGAEAKRIYAPVPYAVVVHDMIQRYVPESVSAQAAADVIYENHRHADRLLVTSHATQNDCLDMGYLPERIVRIPIMLELYGQDDCSVKEIDATGKPYMLWSTNLAPHKNHVNALKGLKKYYEMGGTLDVVITGVNTERLNPKHKREKGDIPLSKSTSRFVQMLEQDSKTSRHICFKGNLDKQAYLSCLKHARFLLHPGYGDNGNGTTFDAACMGVPTLSNDYPAMRDLADFCQIPVAFMDAFDEKKMALALLDMEKHAAQHAAQIPSVEVLSSATISHTRYALYREIRRIVGF